MRYKVAAVMLCVVAFYLLPGANAQGARTYYARLSPVPADLTTAPNVTGSGSVTATLSGTTLSVAGKFADLRSPATVARVHRGRKMGVRGPAAFDLKVSAGTSGSITGSVALTKAQLQDLYDNLYYVQLYSEKAPDGNLWGWLSLQENRR